MLKQFDPRRLQEHPLQVEVPEQLTAWADARYTCQILRNLLSNAFKYSQPIRLSSLVRHCERSVRRMPKQLPRYASVYKMQVPVSLPPSRHYSSKSLYAYIATCRERYEEQAWGCTSANASSKPWEDASGWRVRAQLVRAAAFTLHCP